MKKLRTALIVLCFILCLCLNLKAAYLSDAQLYFDPLTIPLDFYPIIELQDLAAANTFVWQADGDDIVDADILPILYPGDYPVGYIYSQGDYLQKPNADYFADLTTGTLTLTFHTPGLYHVRIFRNSGAQHTYAVYAQAWLKGSKAGKSGASKKIDPVPNGDLFLVEKPDAVMDKSAKVWQDNGRTVERVENKQDIVNKIKAKSQALGRKIHVELDGHGNEGQISIGAGNDTEHILTLRNAAEFQKSIDTYVDHITFQGCSVGAGKDGKRFLQIMADSIGKAGAWDADVAVINSDYFTVPVSAKFVEIVVNDKKEIQYNVPVVINCVGNTDPNVVDGLIKGANNKLKGANIRLNVKQVNKNVNVGDGNDVLNIDEICGLEGKAKQELAKVIKDKKGKWTGKGLKIYVANNCWKEQPSKNNWVWKNSQCLGVKKTIDANDLAEIIRKYFHPESIHDPNDDGDKAQIHAEARLAADTLTAETKIVTAGGSTTSSGPDRKLALQAAILDDRYDIIGSVDPCNPMYCYADIHSIALTGSDLSEPDGQTTIRIVLNGTFPGTMPNPYLPPNPDRMFDTLYSLNIDSTTSHGQIMMRIWRETALGPTQTFAWYDGPYSGYIGSLLVLDNELVGDPNEITDETIITNNTLELTVSNSLFFDPGSDPFEGQVALSAQSTVNDGGIILNDSAQDIDGPFFELSLALPDETPSIYLLGPSTDPNGRGLGITGHGLTQNTLVQINLDGECIGETFTDTFGRFLYFAGSNVTLEPSASSEPHLLEVITINPLGDTTDMQSAAVEFNYLAAEPLQGDIDKDGDVDLVDFAILADNWLMGK